MKARVNEDCIGCGLCATLCPQVFEMVGDMSEVTGDVAANYEQAQEAASACPVNAIEIEG